MPKAIPITMKCAMLSFLLCEIIQDFSEKGKDIENELKNMGRNIGIILLEAFEFNRDIEIPSLVYKITYFLLPKIYECSRKIEVYKEKKNYYVITEKKSFLSTYVSPIDTESSFSVESLIAGIIEAAILATGYKSSVNAYTSYLGLRDVHTIYSVEVQTLENITFRHI